MIQQLGQIITVGPFFAGNTGPDLDLIFLWDSGGFANLADSYIELNIRRWDPRRKVPLGPVITNGMLEIINAPTGEARFDWTQSTPLGSVPRDPGWYMLQADITWSTGKEQLSQRAVFEVLPA